MKIASVLCVIILFLSTGSGCKRESNVMETKGMLEIKPSSQKIKLGQDVNLTIELKNTTSEKLWANQRMLVNSAHAPAMMREVWLEVTGPDGEKIPFSSRVRAGEARPGDYGVLKPGQTVSKQTNLASYFELKMPGVYQVTAHYQDGTQEIPPAVDGASHLVDQLTSTPVEFELISAD